MTAPPRPGRPHLATAAFVLSAAVSIAVLFAPEVPGPDLVVIPGLDKVVHVLLFALLTTTSRWRLGRRVAVLAVLAAYAGGSEVVQALWLSSRGGDVLDLTADLVGVAAAWFACDAWARARTGSVPATSPEATRTDP